MINRILLFMYFLFCSSNIFSQQEAEQIVGYESEIESLLINPTTGGVIVKTIESISSYNPKEIEYDWKITDEDLEVTDKHLVSYDTYKKLNNSKFRELQESIKDVISRVPNSNFLLTTIKNKSIILNPDNGQLLYNSDLYSRYIIDSYYLKKENTLLILAVDNSNCSCIYYDLDKKIEKWTTIVAPVASFLKSLDVQDKLSESDRELLFNVGNDIYITIDNFLYKIYKANGAIAWKTNDQFSEFMVNPDNTHIMTLEHSKGFLRKEENVNLLDASSGKKLWAESVSSNQITYVEDIDGAIMLAYDNGLTTHNYSNGVMAWKKEAKGKEISYVMPIAAEYLYLAEKELNLIGKDGSNKWKKQVKIRDSGDDTLFELKLESNQRLFYLTASSLNMITFATGEKVWKKDVKLNSQKPVLHAYDWRQSAYYVFNDSQLYKININDAGMRQPEVFASVSNILSEKTLLAMEVYPWGICLFGESDVIGIDNKGDMLYHNLYVAPKRILNKELYSVVLKNLDNLKAKYTQPLTNTNQTIKERNTSENNSITIYPQFEDRINDGICNYIKAQNISSSVSQTFRTLNNSRQYLYLSSQTVEGFTELVKVRKSDGKEMDRIMTQDKFPTYQIDNKRNRIYFVRGTEMKVYSDE